MPEVAQITRSLRAEILNTAVSERLAGDVDYQLLTYHGGARQRGRAPDYQLRGPGIDSRCCCLGTWAISFTPRCLCNNVRAARTDGSVSEMCADSD
ncbi:hypothetical protein LSAT2_021570 [Lamellibrachia satsuma]|nr:hypothetical protein LSAT2_021570 [Lamellibrachia satsuma]